MASIFDYGFDLVIDAVSALIRIGLLAGVFSILNITPFFDLDIMLFLNQYGVALFVWIFSFQILSTLSEVFNMEIRGM